MRMLTRSSGLRRALAVAATLPSLACSGMPGDDLIVESTAETRSEILNGDVMDSPDIHPLLQLASGGVCSGVLLTDRWVLTAKHCGADGATTLSLGNESRGVAQLFNHPSLDVTLLQASAPFPAINPTSMFPWAPSRLVGSIVTCYGYGRGTLAGPSGTLRRGTVRITSASNLLTVAAADAREQLPYKGDSGGGCFLENYSRALVGLVLGSAETGTPTTAALLPTSAFSQWALPIIAGPERRLACLGRECVSNPRPLPDNVALEFAWQPCPGQLRAPGAYRFDYEARYDFERGFDSITVNGQKLTGAGTQVGSGASASHLGHRLMLYTDFSNQSPGLSWLRAKCPNDP